MTFTRNMTIALAAGCLAGGVALQVQAQSVEDFYSGRDITLYIGYSSGGGYDAYSRTVARHMRRHIPGEPGIVAKNQPGAGSLLLANALYDKLPQDGTALGMIGRGIPMEALFGNKQARFDPTKFNWIGSTNNEVSVCVAWKGTGFRNLDDLREKEIIVGGTGPGADTDTFPKVLNNVAGTKFQLITGYPGGNNINIAMERGEVQGRCGWSWSSVKATRPQWLEDGTVNVILQMSTSKHPELTEMGVPFVMDLAETERERKIMTLVFARQAMGRPLAAGPGVLDARVAALRDAFSATVEDKQFIADVRKQNLELAPLSGREVQDLVADIMSSPPDVVQAAKEAAEKTGNMFIKTVEVEMVEHEGPVTQTANGGRQIFIRHDGQEVKADVSGSRTDVTIDGKNGDRANIEKGMTCTFTYPSAGSEAKKVDCES